jgi:acetyl-CoA synthetase
MIYMPMIPEAAAAMLACARIGAVHSVVFGGFSPESLAGRIEDCGASVVITADEGVRGGKRIPLKANVDAACEKLRASTGDRRHPHRRRRADEAKAATSLGRPFATPLRRLPARADGRRGPAVHPLHLGLDRQAQGRRPHHRRLCLWAATTFDWVFDLKRGDDVFWCTADVGWITGHSYIVYGPLPTARPA